MPGRTTLTRFLIDQRRHHPEASGELNALLLDVALACRAIGRRVAHGALRGDPAAAGDINTHGETQRALDVVADELFVRSTEAGGVAAGLVSEESERPRALRTDEPGKYLLAYDPLDGSSNLDVNVSVGSIFSVLRSPEPGGGHVAEDYLQPGNRQVAAGYAIYGPSTQLVLSVGTGVHVFTLDPDLGEFIRTGADVRIPPSASEFAINTSNQRFWEPPVRRYVDECLAGSAGPRGKDFNLRWIASLVAEAHRILTRGGVFLYPRDHKVPGRAGRLRLLYEADPIAFLVEQAGGRAGTGRGRILDLVPGDIHERVPLIFGAAEEVDRLERYHTLDPDTYDVPLFGVRGLFAQPS